MMDFSALTKLLALEYNCEPDDFLRMERENVLTVPCLREGRRLYSKEKYFFHMCTLGTNAVITAHKCLHPFLSDLMRENVGFWLFEMEQLHQLEKELNKYGYTLTDSYHMFLSNERIDSEGLRQNALANLCKDDIKEVVNEKILGAIFGNADMPLIERISNDNLDLKSITDSVIATRLGMEESLRLEWFSDGEITQFYGNPLMKNAILEQFDPKRPDRLLLCAYINNELIAAAGCSEDAEGFMQIGIDVDEKYRSCGVGTLLVNMLKNRIEDNGAVPFYGTSAANYHSWNLALKCGFRPAWVEIGAKKL